MRIESISRLVPKPDRGGQDAAYPLRNLQGRFQSVRFAVADGATSSLRAGVWAQELARRYCQCGLPERRLREVISRARRRWCHAAAQAANDWVQRALLRAGAGATLAGIMIRDADFYQEQGDGLWSTLIVGDCACFQIRDDRLVIALPSTSRRALPIRPFMVMTESSKNAALPILRRRGFWVSGDTFYLMSDALARWFLREHEQGDAPWSTLDGALRSAVAFSSWVRHSQRVARLEVDDVVVTRIRVGR